MRNAILIGVGSAFTTRAAVVIIALLVIIFRLPGYFVQPQFWAEDGLAWLQTHTYGLTSLIMPMAGYQLLAMHLIALFAEQFPISAAPAIYFYSTVAVTLSVVWLVMSPRLEIPFRPLCALAVVTSYQGLYVFGGIANLQWVLPVAACALIFMRPHPSRFVFSLELAFMCVMSLTGPFSVFLAPLLFIWAALTKNPRIIAFLVVVGVGAALQSATMLSNVHATLPPGEHDHQTVAVIINTFFRKLFSPFGKLVFNGWAGAVATMALSAVLFLVALRQPNQKQKTFMLVFSGAMFAGQVLKSGIDLDETYALRYFYIASILAVWFVALSVESLKLKRALVAVIGSYQLVMVAMTFNTGLIKDDLEWRVWAKALETGLPVTFPIPPLGWNINAAPSHGKQYSALNSWVGQPLKSVASISIRPCAGSITSATLFSEPRFENVVGSNEYRGSIPRWRISGTVESSPPLIVITDSSLRVVGFGYAGFKSGSSAATTWIGTVPNGAGDSLNAYAVEGPAENIVCQIATTHTPHQAQSAAVGDSVR